MKRFAWSLVLCSACADELGSAGGTPDPVAGIPGPLDRCSLLGLPRVPFEPSTGEARLDVAADFSVPTTEGRWVFSENFTGCETYLFVPSIPAQEAGWFDPLWEEDGEELRDLLPPNTHLFFVSVESDQADIDADLAMVETTVETGIKKLPDVEEEALRARLHYVTKGVDDLDDDWVGRYLDSPGFGFGIDRNQRIRDIGSLADGDRYSASAGWFQPNLAHVAHEAIAYNWEAERDAAMAADGATVIPSFASAVVEDSGWTGVRAYADLLLPDAETMAGFDTLTLDLTMGCVGDGEYGTCPAWDRIVDAFLCEVDDPTVCTVELGRWISAYHREGRWTSDASFLLPLLRDGGPRRIAMYSIDPYEITLDWRFSAQGASNPLKTEMVWRAMPAMDDNYLSNFPAKSVWVPADAERVELTVVVTGHGMSSGLNCAEFCDITHTFTVNGVSQSISFPQTNEDEDCQHQVDDGTVPNQYGTWFYGRANWCPGKVVKPLVLDFTDAVEPGGWAEISYEAFGPAGPLPGGEASTDLTVFLTSRGVK